MFEWFPILNGRYFTYQEYLFILTIIVFSFISVSSFLLAAYLNRSKKPKFPLSPSKRSFASSQDYYESRTEASSVSSDDFSSFYPQEQESLYINVPKVGTKGGNAALWVAWFFFSILPGSFATFDVIFPMWLAALIDYSIIMTRIRYQEKQEKKRLYQTLQQKDKMEAYESKAKPIAQFYKKMVIFFTILSIVLPLIFNGFCASAYQEYVGPVFGTASLSTTLTRFFQLSKACPPGPPCHLYATLPEDGSTSVFINAHTDESYESISIFYDTVDRYETTNVFRYSKDSVSFEIDGTDSEGKRRVHSFYLSGLRPDTRYYLQLVYDGAIQTSAYYQTLPDETNPRDLVIVQGGDIGDTTGSRQIALAASQYNPDVLVLGGDIAYDNGMCTCYFAWDYLFRDLDLFSSKAGRLVPILVTVGNHDVGLDSVNGKDLKVTEKGPFYMIFFPQHSKITGKQTIPDVPALEERKTYHYHKLGKLIIFNLDSGYLEDIGGDQTTWLQLVLEKYPAHLKFANYHSPIYFACKGHDSTSIEAIQAQKENWVPLFDDHKFAIAFENHEHHMKRTFALRNDTLDDEGTIYVGNGQWGTDDYDTCESYNQTGLYNNVQNVHHFWVVNVSFSQGVITNAAYGDSNNVIAPAVSQEISSYLLD